MPRRKSWYRLEAHRLREVLERLSLKDGLLLWEALGEDPGAFPLGKAAALKKGRNSGFGGTEVSPGIARNEGTKCPAPLRAGERKPPTKTEKRGDKMSPGKKGNQGTERPRYTDPAGALAQELGGWRAGLLYRARKEQNPLIQKLAHQHRESLLELLNLAEGLPLPRRIPTALAWLPEFDRELERLGDAAVQKVLLEVRKRGAEKPLSYAARVLAARRAEQERKEETWQTIDQF